MADTKTSAKTPAAGAPPPQAPGPSLGQRVAGLFRPPANGGSIMRRRTSSTTRFIVGSITFILVAELLTYLIDFANLQFKLNLSQPILGASATWFTWFFLINVVVILGLWITLNKLGFFPRDMWAPRNGTTAARGGSTNGRANGAGSNGNKNNANEIPGIGNARTRAERRHTAAVAAAAAAAKAANSKSGKGRTATTDKRTATAAVEPELSAEHDEEYDRAKAAQRLRMRRARR